ncbi:MAG: hypothetical protein A4S09_07375 [Proteobacteria bacterium SG_bin7]|nr:MAG: hypothetical protein A4S09_07375 [Proteobacteria bacterium SG_bin7]
MKLKIIVLLAFFAGHLAASPNTQLRIGIGSSSNPTQSLESTDTSFSQFKPEWKQPFYSTDKTTYAATISANLRFFDDEYVASNANYTNFIAELSAETSITSFLTGGVNFHAGKTVDHIPSAKIKKIFGEESGYNELALGVFGKLHWGDWLWQLEPTFVGRDFALTSYDNNENIILDDHKDFHNILRVTYDPVGDLKVDLSGSWRNRRYVDTPLNPISKLSAPAEGSTRPLEFLQEDYTLVITPELDEFKAETLIGMGWDVDRTNNATTQKRGRLTQKFEFPFWKEKLKLRPLLDVTFKHFPNLTLPLIPVPRSDTIITAAVELGFAFSKKLEAAVGFYKLGSSSNSLANNYYEDFLSTEITATF